MDRDTPDVNPRGNNNHIN